VLFDAVGTLIELRESVGTTYARVARRHGVDVPASRLEEAFHRVLAAAPPNVHPREPASRVAELEREWWRRRVRETFRAADQMVRFDDFEACFQELWRIYAGPSGWRLCSGAEEALLELRSRGWLLAVASNFDHRLPGLLDALGIGEVFATITLPGEAGAAKPDPALFEHCLARLGVLASEAVCVGDRQEEDLRGAREAGLHGIHVATLATLSELPARIEELSAAADPGAEPATKTAEKGRPDE
jgi:putative hydrolase of the HAD superfamily